MFRPGDDRVSHCPVIARTPLADFYYKYRFSLEDSVLDERLQRVLGRAMSPREDDRARGGKSYVSHPLCQQPALIQARVTSSLVGPALLARTKVELPRRDERRPQFHRNVRVS